MNGRRIHIYENVFLVLNQREDICVGEGNYRFQRALANFEYFCSVEFHTPCLAVACSGAAFGGHFLKFAPSDRPIFSVKDSVANNDSVQPS